MREFYIQDEELASLGVSHKIFDGDDYFTYNNNVFHRVGGANYIASIIQDVTGKSHNIIIKSVSNLLEVLGRDVPGEWIFRGQASCRWPLLAGIYRENLAEGEVASLILEKRMFTEFKRRARAFLPNSPSSSWEWLIVAQHFGVPTRLLDWTENSLVALFFAVNKPLSMSNDGILYAYRHRALDLDIDMILDPFSIQRIEVLRPAHLEPRVIRQQSIFTVEPYRREDAARAGSELLSWHIPTEHAADIKEELDRLGISEATLFPGLESLAKEIRRKLSGRFTVMEKSGTLVCG